MVRPRQLWLPFAAAAASAPPPSSPLYALTGPGLTDTNATPPGASWWDTDLCVPLQALGATWLVGGDVLDGRAQRGAWLAANAAGLVSPSGGFAAARPVEWALRAGADGLPAPLLPRTGASTVPSGFVVVPAAAAGPATAPSAPLFAFFMNVTDWRDGVPGNVSAQGLLVRGSAFAPPAPPELGEVVFAAAQDAPLVNAAPVISPLDGYLYIFATALYRASPVFLAQADATQRAISDQGVWLWLAAATPSGPKWGGPGAEMDAAPLPLGDGSLVGVGELSAIYHAAAQRFVLCFFNYSRVAADALPTMFCMAAPQPWGPWSSPQVVVDGTEAWFPAGTGGPYGGYVLESAAPPEAAAAAAAAGGLQIRVTVLLSLWLPYRVFAFETSFDGSG